MFVKLLFAWSLMAVCVAIHAVGVTVANRLLFCRREPQERIGWQRTKLMKIEKIPPVTCERAWTAPPGDPVASKRIRALIKKTVVDIKSMVL